MHSPHAPIAFFGKALIDTLIWFLQLGTFHAFSWSASAETVVKILYTNPIPKVREIWQSAAVEFEHAHPAVKVQFDYLENEAFKAKLPTLLQSKERPSIFHSWGGRVMLEQIQAGVCQDITNAIAGDFKDSFYPAGVNAFMSQGKSYGLPDNAWSERFLV